MQDHDLIQGNTTLNFKIENPVFKIN